MEGKNNSCLWDRLARTPVIGQEAGGHFVQPFWEFCGHFGKSMCLIFDLTTEKMDQGTLLGFSEHKPWALFGKSQQHYLDFPNSALRKLWYWENTLLVLHSKFTQQCHYNHACNTTCTSCGWIFHCLTLTVPITTIDALRHFETG